MDGRALIEAWYQRVWIEGDIDAIDAMFPASTAATGMMDFAVGAEDMKVLVPAFRALVEEPVLKVERVIEAEGWVAALITVKGYSALTQSPFAISGQLMAHVENGVFTEAYNTIDLMSFFTQIGSLPADAIALGLAGEQICP